MTVFSLVLSVHKRLVVVLHVFSIKLCYVYLI
jgi:hypothetical protein